MVRAERGEREILACQEGEQRAVSGGCRQAGGGAGMEVRSGPSPVRDGDAGYPSSLLGNMTLRLAVAVGWVVGVKDKALEGSSRRLQHDRRLGEKLKVQQQQRCKKKIIKI